MTYNQDKDGYVSFSDVSRQEMGKQCQYGSRYVTGTDPDYPNLGEGLRFKNLKSSSYYDIQIHADDIPEFVRRYEEYKKTLPRFFQ